MYFVNTKVVANYDFCNRDDSFDVYLRLKMQHIIEIRNGIAKKIVTSPLDLIITVLFS